MNLSVVIIAKNEENVIGEAIKSASFAQEVIVVDSHSTDRTLDIAKQHGAKVFQKRWEGYGAQKNYGMEQATSETILFLDADERISPELQQLLLNTNEPIAKDVYWITVEDIFLGRRMKHLVGHNPRLVKKGAASWTNKRVHEQLVYTKTETPVHYKDGISGNIEEPIVHHSHVTISSYLKKMHRYTTLDAKDMKENKVHRSGRSISQSIFLPYVLALRQLVKLLFYRKGILDGWQGIVWSFLSAYYEFEMGMKYLHL